MVDAYLVFYQPTEITQKKILLEVENPTTKSQASELQDVTYHFEIEHLKIGIGA